MEPGASSSLGLEAAVSSSLGAMGPLLRKLDLLLTPKYWLPKRVKEGIGLLKEDLEEVSSALSELLTVATTSLRAKCWMEEARELSYDVEDFVDGMIRTRTKTGMIRARTIVDARMRSARGPRRMGRVKIAGLPPLPKRSTRISRIETFRTLLREASERYERYQLDYCCSSSSFVTIRFNQTPAFYGDAVNLVGINDSKIKLIEMLTIQGDQKLKVVSIVGPGGIGKTTLAKEVYHELGKQFEIRAFVRASRKPDMRRLLGVILSQVRQHQQPPFNAVPVQHLIDIIKEHFQDKRYFIVIDDLWERTAWDILCAAFPHGDNSSRIIVTTENVNVSLGCCGYRQSNILKMKALNIHDSGKLFFSRVFNSEQCPEEIKEISHGIIRDCGGFPLAIINLAGLLASQLDYSELWYHVQDNLCAIVNKTCTADEMHKEILNLCYNSLPRCLKTCLLYFTMYPEGYIIRKVDLVKQWMAEGFINATEGKQFLATADSYFDELVNRGMIQPVEIDYSGKVLSCTVHHIVLDFITQKSKEEKFISAIDCSQTVTGLTTKFHRISFHFSSARYGKQPAIITMSRSRSLAFFGLVKCMPSIMKFKLLRVLILQIWGNHHEHASLNISRVCRLLQLRYLKVSSDILVELPAQMRELLYLETLEIDARICAVPLDIVCLPSLMHLCLRGATNLPDGINRLKSLCTLQYFDISRNSESNLWSLGELTNLRHLQLTCSATLSDEHLKRKLMLLVSSLRKFSNLESLTLSPDASGRARFFYISSSISPPSVSLQRLELLPPFCFFSRLPSWLGQLHGLRILNIVIQDLASDDINILTGLPALTVLMLYVRTALKRTIIFTDMAFSALRYLKLSCSVMFLSFLEGALPDLRRLKLCFNANRENNYSRLVDGIEHLLNLQEVAGRIGEPQGADELDRKVVESLLEDAIKKHPRGPSINIRWVDSMVEDPTRWKQHKRLQEDSSGEDDILHGSNTKDTNIRSASRFSEVMHPPSASRYSDKEKELGDVQAEIKALRLSDRAREKAVQDLTEELAKVDGKLKLTESLLESKNLEAKKINDEKKAALAAQFAAEATLRRVHAVQKDDDMPPIKAILAPLEAEIKLARQEIAKLQDDNRALDRLTKSKEAGLLEAERMVEIALAKASLVDDMQNKNQELMKQIEICQEENKILDRMHRQKVAEVEKLTQTVRELEEAVLAGGAAANAVRDYQRKVQEMNEEMKTLDRELACAKVSANRVAVVGANEWKDGNDKVMPVKQWTEERRILQGEMQQLRDKLAIAERAAKSEAQLKDKFQLRLKVLQEGLRMSTSQTNVSAARRQSIGGVDSLSKTDGFLSKRQPFQMRSSASTTTTLVNHAKGASKSFDGGCRSLERYKGLVNTMNISTDSSDDEESNNSDEKPSEFPATESEDTVPGALYDMLQKEVISLRKACHEKDQSLKDKDDATEMLAKKVDTLTKAMESDAKKTRREIAAMEKELAAVRLEKEQDNRAKRFGSSSGSANSSQLPPGRTLPRSGSARNM